MTSIEQSVFIRSLKKQAVARTPVWIMRQAGRYLPEYRKVRMAAGDFLSLCKTPELACEVTMQPLRRYALDAAILFSDILTIPDAMGLGLHFVEGEGPCFERKICSLQDLQKIEQCMDINSLSYVMDAVRLIRRELPQSLPLIGFSGSPWTLACYMVEGGSSRDFKNVLKMMYAEPQIMQQLLQLLTMTVIEYLKAQIVAGVNVVMLFDTWGGILTTPSYQKFSCDYLTTIVTQLKIASPDIPIILFTKGGGQWLQQIAATKTDAVAIDWTCDLARARAQIGHLVALQGNLDPTILLTNPECIRAHVHQVLAAYGHGSGHVFNLGHGVTPDVPPENVAAMVDAVHEFSPFYHES